jgi:hypothetical protein
MEEATRKTMMENWPQHTYEEWALLTRKNGALCMVIIKEFKTTW